MTNWLSGVEFRKRTCEHEIDMFKRSVTHCAWTREFLHKHTKVLICATSLPHARAHAHTPFLSARVVRRTGTPDCSVFRQSTSRCQRQCTWPFKQKTAFTLTTTRSPYCIGIRQQDSNITHVGSIWRHGPAPWLEMAACNEARRRSK